MFFPEDRDDLDYLETIKCLHSPILKECLDAADSYPENAALAMAEVYAIADDLKEMLDNQRVLGGDGKWGERRGKEIFSCADNLSEAIGRLRPILIPGCQKSFGFLHPFCRP
ncbi:hypothetical protein [Comamonas sp.]|uniref:hypothetical protein n=1 Tax=Comamonas sp. TaxID=34028 RepID=UPI002FC6D1EE